MTTTAPSPATPGFPVFHPRLAAGLALSILAHAAAIMAVRPAAVESPVTRPLQVELESRSRVVQPDAVAAADGSDYSAVASGTPRAVKPANSVEQRPNVSEGPRTTGPLLHGVPDRYFTSRELDVRAAPLFMVPLVYPPVAYQQRIRGKVLVKVLISHLGEVDDATVVDAEPAGIFEEAALNAVRPLKFSPAIRAGRAVKSLKMLEVKFEPYRWNDRP